MDLAKDMLDVAEKVGQAPGLTMATSIVTSILKTVQTSKSNTLRLKTLAHSLASQLIDISENMKGKWDDAPLTLKRAVDEYDAFLLEMLKSITRLSQYSRLRGFLLAGECEAEITRLEKRVADVRSTIMLMIGMNLSVMMNQVRTSLVSYGHDGREVHSGMQRLVDETNKARRLNLEANSSQITPDFSLFTRDDFQVTKTISHPATYDQQIQDVTIITIHRAERCSNGRAILVKTFEGNDLRTVRQQFTEELEMIRKALNPSLLQIIGWSCATAQLPFHVYHAPGGIIEDFYSWSERTMRSNPVELIFGLYDMHKSIKELFEFCRSRNVEISDVFEDGVVNIQQHGDRPQVALIHAGELYKKRWQGLSYKQHFPQAYDAYRSLRNCGSFEDYKSISDMLPVVTLASMFAGGAKDWFKDQLGIDALFTGRYDTINPLQLGPALLEAGCLSTSSMSLKQQGSMRLGDVGYLTPDGHFKVVANLHTKLILRSGGLPGWTYIKTRRQLPEVEHEEEDEDEYAVVTHAETLYRRYNHVMTLEPLPAFVLSDHHCAQYTDLDKGRAWKIFQQEAFRIIEENRLSIAPHELQLHTSISHHFTLACGWRRHWSRMTKPTKRDKIDQDPVTITLYEFQREGSLSVLDSGAPELNPEVLYSFQENIDGLDPTKLEYRKNPEIEDIFMQQDRHNRCHIEYLQLSLGVTRPSSIEEIPD